MQRGAVLVVVLLALLAVGSPASPQQQEVGDPSATSAWPCPHWGMYGANLERTFSTQCASDISRETVARLVPAWAFTPGATVTASPAVVDEVVYVGDWHPRMYALHAVTGAELWSFEPPEAPDAAFGPIVSSPAVADVRVDGRMRRLVVFGSGPRIFALDAVDGQTVWERHVGGGVPGDPTQVESSAAIWQGVVYIGMDTHNRPEQETGGVRGGLLALDATDGRVLWKFEPELDRPGSGCGGVWSSPAVDTARGQVHVGGANCPTDVEWTPHVEALTALDARTGEPRWAFQPEPGNRDDTDFGATPNLFTDADGREVVGIGKKDAVYYALDPDGGELLWATQVAEPGNMYEDFAVGGFIGSTAVWEGHVYGGTAIGGAPYFHSLDGRDGSVRWQSAAGPTYAASAAVNGVVFAGDLTGSFKAFDAETGAVLWSSPVAGPVSSGPAVVGNRVYVGAGTSSSDACAKDAPGSELCFLVFENVLGAVGGVHAFQLAGADQPSPQEEDEPAGEQAEDRRAPSPGPAGQLPATGGWIGLVGLALAGLGIAARR